MNAMFLKTHSHAKTLLSITDTQSGRLAVAAASLWNPNGTQQSSDEDGHFFELRQRRNLNSQTTQS